MSPLSPLAGLSYESSDDDLVRFRAHPGDHALSNIVRSLFDSLEGHRDDVRSAWREEDTDTLLVFARRRLRTAYVAHDARAINDALDAYALVAREEDVPWESWFKATLVVARELGFDPGDLRERFVRGANDAGARRGAVAFDALARVADLSACHVVSVETTYGPGLVESTVVRDQTGRNWGGITAVPVTLGQYQVSYAPRTNLAQLAVDAADALDATARVRCSPIRQDQLVATNFDLVTSGSYVDSLGCFSFFADSLEGGTDVSVTVAEVDSEDYDDVRFEANELAAELADAADALEEQAAFAQGPRLVVLGALPDFSGEREDRPDDLARYLADLRDLVERAVTTP